MGKKIGGRQAHRAAQGRTGVTEVVKTGTQKVMFSEVDPRFKEVQRELSNNSLDWY